MRGALSLGGVGRPLVAWLAGWVSLSHPAVFGHRLGTVGFTIKKDIVLRLREFWKNHGLAVVNESRFLFLFADVVKKHV